MIQYYIRLEDELFYFEDGKPLTFSFNDEHTEVCYILEIFGVIRLAVAQMVVYRYSVSQICQTTTGVQMSPMVEFLEVYRSFVDYKERVGGEQSGTRG